MEFAESLEFFSRNENIFISLKKELMPILPVARIEHIGSSSVKGAISKGDLDVFIGVHQSSFEMGVEKVKTIGFYEKDGTLKTESLRMMITDKYREDVAIQIVANGSEFECFIQFRDILRSSVELVEEYNRLKLECKGMSHDEYRDIKSSFIEGVLYAP